jgi:ferredoxin
MAISKVWIEEGCTACGLCEDICPEVFVLNDEAEVKEGVDFNAYEDKIIESAEECPVEVIKYE